MMLVGWSRVNSGFITEQSRYVGAAHLALAGVLNLIASYVLAVPLDTERGLHLSLMLLKVFWTESYLVAHGDLLVFAFGTIPLFGAIAFLFIGILQVAAGIAAAAGRYYSLVIGTAIIGMASLITIPVGAIAVVLLWCCQEQFHDRRAER